MEILKSFRNCLKVRNNSQLVNKSFVVMDGFIAFLCIAILVFSDNRSTCLASFYLFWALFYLGQTISHYLLIRLPTIDAMKFDKTIKRLIGIVCLIQIFYLLLVIIYWQKSNVHPIYCAVCQQFQLPYAIGILFIFHFIISAGIMITLIHLFVTRKYYLIALGGFQVEQRLALQREESLRRVGLIQPNYAYPIDSTIKSGKYYKFDDVIQPSAVNEQICSICLNVKLETQNIIKTKCNHFYHRDCVQKWATVNSRCPDCRVQFQQDFTERKLLDSSKTYNLPIIQEMQDGEQNQSEQ